MHWQDEAFILHVRPQGERHAIVEVMSAEHGRHFGLLQGGRSMNKHALLQMGNFVKADWHARLEEHLGYFHLEILFPFAGEIMHDPLLLYGFQLLIGHLRLLPEREVHKKLYKFVHLLLKKREDKFLFAQLLVRFELLYLKEMGFGLNLTQCVVTKSREDLCYVSPKTGCAVTRHIGEAWQHKLLKLPFFLLSFKKKAKNKQEICQAFHLTGYFLERHLWHPRHKAIPLGRINFIKKFCDF